MLTGQKVEEQNWDNLIYDDVYPRDTVFVKMSGGQGIFERGTVIQMASADGEGSLYDGTQKARYILAEETDTGTESAGVVYGLVYRSGHFNKNALIIKEDAVLSKEAEETLRDGGIYLSSAME